MRRFTVILTALILLAGSAGAAEWATLYERAKGQGGMRPFCRTVRLADGRLFFWTPIFPSTLDPETGTWTRLVPKGKEAWREQLPKVRRAGTRWGNRLSFYKIEDVTCPLWMTHFNQFCYVPAMKKVLFFVGARTFAFDLETHLWEPLTPEHSPPHVVWSAMCYDPVNDEVVLFGGGAACDENRPGTWLFDPKTKDWRKLDQPLAEQPPPRCNAPLVYDPKNKLIIVFGGDAQDRYLSDTWVYDCAKRRWRELETNVRPFPRTVPVLCTLGDTGRVLMGGGIPGVPWPPGFRHRPRGDFGNEIWMLDPAEATWTRVAGAFPLTYWQSAVYDARAGRVLLSRFSSRYHKYGALSVLGWKPALTPSEEKGTLDPGEPVYKYHPPEWYRTDVPPADEKAGEKLFAALKPNVWTPYKPPKDAMMRTWGSATIDTGRHEILYWGGGHCGYCGTDVSHFSLKTLRWSSSFPPEFPGAPYSGFYGNESSFLLPCRSFHGRPWVQHGRVSYAWDPVTKTCVFTQSISAVPTRGWTYVYDPVKRDFIDIFPQPFIGGWSVSGLTVTTPHGVYCYLSKGDHRSRQVGLFKCDVKARTWTNLSDGKAPVSGSEKNRVVYDSKRDRLILLVSRGERKMYAWDLAAAQPEWTELAVTGDVPKAYFREGVYVPKYDTILNITQGHLYACALSAGNRWTKINAVKAGVSTSFVYDPGLDVLVHFSGGNTGPVRIKFMRYVPADTKEAAR
jgi:hypothetical protein